jgi:RND superfamily putative drug exporter
MFSFLGQVVRRAWLLLLVTWTVLVIGTWLAAPSWREIAQDREFTFLPEDAPSRIAEKKLSQAFPGDRHGSNIVLVIQRAGNEPGRLEGDNQFIEDVLYKQLLKIADDEGGLAGQPAPSNEPLFSDENTSAPPPQKVKRSIIARIRTPVAPGAGAFLVSPDGQAQLITLDLTTEFLSTENWPTINKIENLLGRLRQEGKIPQGLDIAMTGSAIIGRDHTLAEFQSVRATGLLTVVLVVVLLVLIYRAPLLALIPLITVYLAVQLALNILALLGKGGYLDLFQGLQVYITILAYGAGVDYCLFLTARYKEELDQGVSPADAVARAIGGVGGALTASAATVICGIAMMLFAQFGKFQVAGFAIPLTLVIVLLATLTFSPSLLRLAGRWAFWPHRQRTKPDELAAKPGRMGGLFQAGELERIWDRVGQLLLRRAGTVWLGTVLFMVPFVVIAGLFYNRLSYDIIVGLPADAPSVVATRILQQHFPAGVIGPITVLAVAPQVDFERPEGNEIVKRVTEQLAARKDDLRLADIRSLTAPLGITKASTVDPFAGLNLPEEVRKEAAERGAQRRYTTSLGERHYIGTRLELILAQNPFSQDSIDDLNRVEQAVLDAVPGNIRPQTQLYFAGTTPSVRDLAMVMGGDRVRINLLVVASVFVILILLLRQLVVTVYLLLSVLFSYYVTLGVTFGVFWLLDPSGFPGLDWKVAMFLFTILIAVGEDYNIFLMTRVHEEDRRYGPIRGITQALDRTGPIISSCGIIMAGTFGTLLAGSLNEMKQLGFALAFGVLLDTFIVRPILVPAFLMLLRRGRIPLLRSAVKTTPESTQPQAQRSGVN